MKLGRINLINMKTQGNKIQTSVDTYKVILTFEISAKT